MKKHILKVTAIMILVSLTATYSNATSSLMKFKGVSSFNGFPVKYIHRNILGHMIAIIGNTNGSIQGECFHDGVQYAAYKGMATCPGYFNVFPQETSSPTIDINGKSPESYILPVNNKHYNNSPACQETSSIYDPFN